MKKTFELWEKIFKYKNYNVSKSLHYITAQEIKDITNFEPRIMAKIDNSKDLPPIFKNNGYFLLPVRNGKFAIVKGEGFHTLEKIERERKYTSKIKFPLTMAGRSRGEMQYLDYSINSGALEEIINAGTLYPSIRGREFCKKFNFIINKTMLQAFSVQIEVDSGLEGEHAIVLIEAKINKPIDFIIRQLFYPYRHYKILSPNKEIIPVFFTYDFKSTTYNFWIYQFTDIFDYNSLQLKRSDSIKITKKKNIEIQDIIKKSKISRKNIIPQANDLDKIIELVFKVEEGINDYHKVAKYFQFRERQSSYYREATEALGLLYSEKGKYYLTDLGKRLVSLSSGDRNIFFTELLLDFELLSYCIEKIIENGFLKIGEIKSLIREKSYLNETTINRRANSLIAWLRWVSKKIGGFYWLKSENEFRNIKS